MSKESVRKVLGYWPFVVFTISITAHTDLAIFGHERFQRLFHVGMGTLCLGIIIVGAFQLWYEYWFLGWCRDDVGPKFREKIVAWFHRKVARLWELAKEWEADDLLREIVWYMDATKSVVYGLARRVHSFYRIAKIHLLRAIVRAAKKRPFQYRLLKFIKKYLKGGGYGAVALTSILPWPGVRTPAILLCRATNSKKGIWVLTVGNAFRTWYLLYGLHVVFGLLH